MAKCAMRRSKGVFLKTSKPIDVLEDVICPICMGILIEPVTTPCQHELCLVCFNRNVELLQIACPICRKRISSWARQAVRNKTLVDAIRWKQIQDRFPDHIKRRLDGRDEGNSFQECVDAPACYIPISQPGEIRKEYEEFLKKFREEEEREKESQTLASLQLIKDLQLQEEKQMVEERQRRRHTVVSHDDILGKETLNKQYPRPSGSRRKGASGSQPSAKPDKDSATATSSSASNMKGALTSELLASLDQENPQLRSQSAESQDSISSEMCHFKPISAAPRTPPKRLPDGRFQEPQVVHTKARRLDYSSDLQCSKVLSVKIQAVVGDSQNKTAVEGVVPIHSSGTPFVNKKFNGTRKPNIDLSFKENYPFYSSGESLSLSPIKSVLTGANQNGSTSTRPTRNAKGSKQSCDENNAHRKRKTEEKAVTQPKMNRQEDEETDASTSDSQQAPSTNCEEEISWVQMERETLERIRQEEMDRQLAVQLQEEFQMGPGNQYFLRSQKKK